MRSGAQALGREGALDPPGRNLPLIVTVRLGRTPTSVTEVTLPLR